MWGIYDEIIDRIPHSLTVMDSIIGTSWACVRCENGVGMAKTVKGGKKGLRVDDFNGSSVRDLAAHCKSWNMLEASIGMAAVNSALNCIDVSKSNVIFDKDSIFHEMKQEYAGKKVAMIGHFPDVAHMKEVCDLYVLEREPDSGDYPDSACEYILPDMDYVFITGTAFTNKTMPRLLQLSKDAYTTIVGPSTPLCESIFKYGADRISTTVVDDGNLMWRAISVGMKMSIFEEGSSFVSLIKRD